MTHIYKTNGYFALGLMLALLSGVLLFWPVWAAAQPDRPDRRVSSERPVAAQLWFDGGRYTLLQELAGGHRRPVQLQGVRQQHSPNRDRFENQPYH